MPYLDTAQSWLEQSALLLKARPTTTRITTKYTLLRPDSKNAKPRTPKPKTTPADESSPAPAAPIVEPIRATLTLKTYDPQSGATLKYSTIKQAEVARLIQILGRLARPMAGLPEVKEDADAVVKFEDGPSTPTVETSAAVAKTGQGGAGGKKKKKGKK